MRRSILGCLLAGTLAACAGGPSRGPGLVSGPIDVSAQSERLLVHAREERSEAGCAKAIPTYRVVASFGKGYDVAQYELGACLLDVEADGGDAALLRDEGVLWLRRAAYAGNARAQLALAEALATNEPVEAQGWALVYAENAAHELYGLPNLSPAARRHLDASLSEAERQTAAAFARDFTEIDMAVFTPPPSERAAQRGRGATGQGRPPRR